MDSFNILPTEIISDILSRLPSESVLDCKLVSKTWINLIQHPSFSKLYLDHLISHSVAASSADSSKLGFLAFTNREQLYYFDYIKNHETPINKIRRINVTPPCKSDSFVGSSNGLICLLLDKWPHTLCICNPMTKEYVILPETKRNSGRYHCTSFGFGYVPSSNEYKVVALQKVKNEPNFVEVMVYTLGSRNGWRNIGKFDLKYNHYYFYVGIFVNGALHWMDGKTWTIIVFDLADENFREPLSPPRFPRGCYDVKFGVLTGLLFCTYICASTYSWYSDTWIYKKKNDLKEPLSLGWTKEFNSAILSTPLAFTKTGDVLGYGSSYINIYDPKASNSKMRVDIGEPFLQVLPHRNTLVSLKELGEEDTKTMQSNKYHEIFGYTYMNRVLKEHNLSVASY